MLFHGSDNAISIVVTAKTYGIRQVKPLVQVILRGITLDGTFTVKGFSSSDRTLGAAANAMFKATYDYLLDTLDITLDAREVQQMVKNFEQLKTLNN